jgi:uncharacterized protein (TIGR00369 family)
MTWITGEPLAAFIESRPFSPAAEELKRKVIAIDPAGQRARLSFEPIKGHCNPMGGVQGGFLIAMLDEAMIEAVVLATSGEFYIPTLTIDARFLRPAKLEKLVVEGRVMRLGRRSAFLEADLYGADEQKRLVTARSTVTMTSWDAIRRKSA